MKIKVITNSGFKYEGEKISQDSVYLKIKDSREGIILIPLTNISLIKDLGAEDERGI